jgi:hypothetical protein
MLSLLQEEHQRGFAVVPCQLHEEFMPPKSTHPCLEFALKAPSEVVFS